jgi:hypothetical protein
MLTIASDEQYKALAAGRAPAGQPLLRTMLGGANKTASVTLPRRWPAKLRGAAGDARRARFQIPGLLILQIHLLMPN